MKKKRKKPQKAQGPQDDRHPLAKEHGLISAVPRRHQESTRRDRPRRAVVLVFAAWFPSSRGAA